jgi:hypothetical protein
MTLEYLSGDGSIVIFNVFQTQEISPVAGYADMGKQGRLGISPDALATILKELPASTPKRKRVRLHTANLLSEA